MWTASLPSPPLSLLQTQWLSLPGSLTRALRAQGDFQLAVLHEGHTLPAADEAQALGVPLDTSCWLREVLMSVNGTPAVLGRSLTPDHPGAHAWQDVRTLSSTPLGVLLYEDPRITRTAFEYAQPHARHPIAQLAHRSIPLPEPRRSTTHTQQSAPSGHAAQANPQTLLWARRSLFRLQQEPLLVSECFLPGLWKIAQPPAA